VTIRAVHSFHLAWNVEYNNYIVLDGSYPLPNGIDPSIKELLPEGGRLGFAGGHKVDLIIKCEDTVQP